MAIPNSQLETWSKQGSITQSASTYASVKNALESTNSLYKNKSFEVFLQGSYGNDTNIYAESDVDVVIRLDSVFRGDIDSLSSEEKTAYHNLPNATYDFNDFKKIVDITVGHTIIPLALFSQHNQVAKLLIFLKNIPRIVRPNTKELIIISSRWFVFLKI